MSSDNNSTNAIESLLLELIGEDEGSTGLTNYYPGIEQDSRDRDTRDLLRAELRTKVPETAKKIVKELKGIKDE